MLRGILFNFFVSTILSVRLQYILKYVFSRLRLII